MTANYSVYARIMNVINSTPEISEAIKDVIDDTLWYDLVAGLDLDNPEVRNWTPLPTTELLDRMGHGQDYQYISDKTLDDMAEEYTMSEEGRNERELRQRADKLIEEGELIMMKIMRAIISDWLTIEEISNKSGVHTNVIYSSLKDMENIGWVKHLENASNGLFTFTLTESGTNRLSSLIDKHPEVE